MILLDCWTLKMKVLSSFKTAGGTCPSTQHHIPEDWKLLLVSADGAKNFVLMDRIPVPRRGARISLLHISTQTISGALLVS
jgi:hypothetical protein